LASIYFCEATLGIVYGRQPIRKSVSFHLLLQGFEHHSFPVQLGIREPTQLALVIIAGVWGAGGQRGAGRIVHSSDRGTIPERITGFQVSRWQLGEHMMADAT